MAETDDEMLSHSEVEHGQVHGSNAEKDPQDWATRR